MTSPAILYVHDLRGSGVVTNAIALARRLGAKRPTILAVGYDKGLNRSVDVAPAQLVVLSSGDEPPLSRLVAAQRLRRLAKARGASLLMSMGNFGHRTVLAASIGTALHTVYRISNEVGRSKAGWLKNVRRRNWQRLLLARADRLVLVGKALADQPLFAAAIASGKARYIANGVDVDRARREADAPSPHPWFDDSVPVVLTIGRIHPQKNLEGLIDGAALALRETQFRLIIVGSGDPARVAALKARATAHRVADSVDFAGETDNVFAWLRRAALFALVSHWEGSSTALLEAIAAGTPILASRQAGDAAHVLDGGIYGVLVDADDAADIAAGVVRQLGANRVLPGNRVDQFRLDATHARYLDALAAL